MPTRLLDVGRGDDVVRLRASSFRGSERPEYVCLSHVWGKAKVYKLTRDTVGDLNSGIGVTQLPKTFQDAIYITKFFGYRYIWIDSLCIIQDSKEDWAKEASRMAMVYGNATCTIAATQIDSQSGCFVNRNPLSLRPCRLLSDRKIYAYTTSDTASLISSPLNSALFRRAWTFQERILSWRTIYLGTEELWWECSTLAANEPYVDGYRNLQIQSLCRHDSFFHSSQENTDSRNITQSHASDFVRNTVDDIVARRWHEIVRQYSMRLLTYDSDKLIAMQGVAAAFEPSIGSTRAGLIEEKMITELSWYVDTEAATLTNASFPSWAWASVKGEIRFRAWSLSKGFSRQAQYVSCDPDQLANASDSAGSQKLVLQGFLRRVSWKRRDDGLKTRYVDVEVDKLGIMCFQCLFATPNQPSWLFVLGRGILNTDDHEDFQADFGLILTDAENGDCFRRVGLFTGHMSKDYQIPGLFNLGDVQTVVIC